jgi:hypothetical protein
VSDHTQDAPGAPDPEPVGELAEEAAKLLGALGAWAREQGPDLGAGLGAGLGAAIHDVSEHLDAGGQPGGSDGPDCRWCPVCRTAHLVRQVSPEVREQLGVAAAALLQAGSGLLASITAAGPPPERGPGGTGPTDPAGGADPAERVPRVERIDLDPDPGPAPDDGAEPHPDPHDPHDHPGGPR